MKSLRELFVGLLSAAGTAVLVLAAMFYSLVEGTAGLPLPPTAAATQTPAASGPASGQVLPATPRLPSPTSACKYPRGWTPYIVQDGDTVDALAKQYGIAKSTLIKGNCMVSTTMLVGSEIRLPKLKIPSTSTPIETVPPPLPTMADTMVPCGQHFGWVIYHVQPGDTLSYLSRVTGVSIYQLQNANCLTSDRIYSGQPLYVPFLPPTRTPILPTDTPTEMPTDTFTPEVPTLTPTPVTPEPTTPVPTTPSPATEEPTTAVTETTEAPYPYPYIETTTVPEPAITTTSGQTTGVHDTP